MTSETAFYKILKQLTKINFRVSSRKRGGLTAKKK